MSGEIKSAILFNRALIWIVLMHLTTSKAAAIMFTVCAALNLVNSFVAWRDGR